MQTKVASAIPFSAQITVGAGSPLASLVRLNGRAELYPETEKVNCFFHLKAVTVMLNSQTFSWPDLSCKIVLNLYDEKGNLLDDFTIVMRQGSDQQTFNASKNTLEKTKKITAAIFPQ